jgi:hypothetical protein
MTVVRLRVYTVARKDRRRREASGFVIRREKEKDERKGKERAGGAL